MQNNRVDRTDKTKITIWKILILGRIDKTANIRICRRCEFVIVR